MKTVFVDTSAFYAVLDRDDANHTRAQAIWARVVPQSTLVTNNYVVVETIALIQRRLGMPALRVFVNDILALVQIEWVAESAHSAALETVLTSARKTLSLVDCVSFQTIRDSGLDAAFCFDAHFRQQGFETL